MISDAQLLAEYARTGSDAAFTELVRRHGGAVRAAALRQTNQPHLAEEVTEAVFLALARKAATLNPSTVLLGWLLRATRYAAIDALRAESRRQRHQAELHAMHCSDPASGGSPDPEAESLWQRLAPYLDQALFRLRELDRHALLLRFFENKTLGAVGAALGIPEEAARKRVKRALERLHAELVRQGAPASAPLLPVVLGSYAAPHLGPELVESTAQGTLAATASPGSATEIGLLASSITRRFFWEGLRPWIAGVVCAAALTGAGISLLTPLAPAPTVLLTPTDDYRRAGFPDAAVVTRHVAELQGALAADRRDRVAALARYPFRVHFRRGSELIADPDEFVSRFDELFPAPVIGVILKSPNYRLFCTEEGVMVGDGTVWIGAEGDPARPQPRLIALNLP